MLKIRKISLVSWELKNNEPFSQETYHIQNFRHETLKSIGLKRSVSNLSHFVWKPKTIGGTLVLISSWGRYVANIQKMLPDKLKHHVKTTILLHDKNFMSHYDWKTSRCYNRCIFEAEPNITWPGKTNLWLDKAEFSKYFIFTKTYLSFQPTSDRTVFLSIMIKCLSFLATWLAFKGTISATWLASGSTTSDVIIPKC